MSDLDFANATAVVFDPVHVNLRTTRYALNEIGFKKIESVTSLSELHRLFRERSFHLLFAETAQNEGDVFKFVRAIRSGEIGDNPFLSIILTCWSRDGAIVKHAIGSGADDVIIRPFSTIFAEERIRTIVKDRKSFIVTSDYIGPDRRRDPDRSSSIKPINPPNILKALAEGDEDEIYKAEAKVKAARQTVEHERIRRLCMRVVVGTEVGMRELKTDSNPQLDIGDLDRAAAELLRRVVRANAAEAVKVTKTLVELMNSIKTEDGFNPSNLGLAKELAMGAFAAFAGGEAASGAGAEIEKSVEILRKRMQNQKQADASPKGDDDLKRAAS